MLKTGNNPNSDVGPIGPGWSLPVRLPDGAGDRGGQGGAQGADDFRDAIKNCIGNPVAIGDYLPTENGAMVGPTAQGVETDDARDKTGPSLVEQDFDAKWEANTVSYSCASKMPPCGPFSPRIVPIAVFDFDEFTWRHEAKDWTTEWIPGTADERGHPGAGTFSCPKGLKPCIRVTNIIGFFVESMSGNDVTGRVLMYPGEFVQGAPNLGSGSSFLQVIQLVR